MQTMEQLSRFVPSQIAISACKSNQLSLAKAEYQVSLTENNLADKSSLGDQKEPNSSISIKGLKPYWDAQCEIHNKKLWLPIKTILSDKHDRVDPQVSSLSNTWFGRKLISNDTVPADSPTTFNAGHSTKTVCQDLEITKAKIVKLYPSKEQKQTFKKWHDCSRYVFNQTID